MEITIPGFRPPYPNEDLSNLSQHEIRARYQEAINTLSEIMQGTVRDEEAVQYWADRCAQLKELVIPCREELATHQLEMLDDAARHMGRSATSEAQELILYEKQRLFAVLDTPLTEEDLETTPNPDLLRPLL